MVNYASHVSTKKTPQNEPIPGSTQVANSGGGFSWKVDCWTRMQRFLILGNEGGSYYAGERKMTQEAASCINECFKLDEDRTIKMIVDVSVDGRAPKNDPAIFALAMLSHSTKALAVMPQVCRIGTHLFQFVEMVIQFRGWGRGLRKAVASWYNDKDAASVAYQVTKYGQRNGWTHHDVLHKCHARPTTVQHNLVFGYAKAGKLLGDEMPSKALDLLTAVEAAKKATTAKEIVKLILGNNLARECIPTQWLNDRDVWAALLVEMPMMAMIRNLGKMSAIGLTAPLSEASTKVCSMLADEAALKKARVHPISILMALTTYRSGHGMKGSLTWTTDPRIVDALDDAYYKAFAYVEPTGKRYLLGLDVSGSMGGGSVAGTSLTPRDAAAAMAMVTARTEQNYAFIGFSRGVTQLPITAKQSLADVIKITGNLPFDATDCALPMIYAKEKNLKVDVFAVYTDSETNCGRIHASQALQEYRQKSGINAKLIVVGMVANNFTIADPNDGGMLDVVGFDTSVPQIMSEFARQ